jgi:hypothetical protein
MKTKPYNQSWWQFVKRVVENLDTTLAILQKVIQIIQMVPSGTKIGNNWY